MTALLVVLVLSFLARGGSQFRNYTAQYAELMERNVAELYGEIELHPDVELVRYPENALLNVDKYRFDFPLAEEYRLNIIMNPCKGMAPDCCMNVFGTAEYPKLKLDGLEAERQQPKSVVANESDIQANFDLVYEDGSRVPVDSMRGADDDLVIDYECVGLATPYARCRGKNYANKRSEDRPACLDYNQTIDVMAGCQTPEGKHMDFCVQVAYTQNTFIGLCDGEYASDPHCGTYLEIHQVQGTPYSSEDFMIAQSKIETRDVSGFYTSTMNLTWDNDPSRVLCTYDEPFIRVGSSVFVKSAGGTPSCCCPKPFKVSTRVGSFDCPISATGRGAYAAHYKTLPEIVATEASTLLYPHCPSGLDDIDRFMCGAFDIDDKVYYTRACEDVYEVATGYTSIDLDGVEYAGVCDYFDNCARTTEADPATGTMKCKMEDLLFSFIGRVGRVVARDDTKDPAEVFVTFNDGRTNYMFTEEMLKLEPGKSMYEVWWVVRTKSEFVVQKRKGFNVSSPQCTFDTVNDRYFPWTMIVDGIPKD